jgi:predicted ATPase
VRAILALTTREEHSMKLVSVHARFFRSLNFDFVKRSSPGYAPLPWDATPSGANYPFVELSLDPQITTVVGANESGKSQVLAAIKFGLTGKGLLRKDFCRYSPLFLTDKVMELPEFGLMFDGVTSDDFELLKEATGAALTIVPERVALFRMNQAPKQRLYLLTEQNWEPFTLAKPASLPELGVPSYFEIDATTPLPDAVPIDYLVSGKITDAFGRDSFRTRWDEIRDNPDWFANEAAFTKMAGRLIGMFSPAAPLEPDRVAKYQLAEALLIQVAGLKRGLFEELRGAIREGNAGYAKSIVDTINTELSRSLNFRHWWKQDDHFELFVEYQEYDLTFMIRDRTGRTYSFDERSGGLKYFLSYFVQYLSHTPAADARPEILLMDEPDAYLSSSGQQDLLRVFEAFAFPEDPETKPIQVVYVTHSPFLIDKNHADRLRVLEKGRNDEGTRVVANASRNHYEPLRSSIGEFVAETTFIGSCNLILEGASDQVMIAGMATWLRSRRTPNSQNLDLNTITIVPAGSAGHVPYMAYLARGRDVDKPALMVLLDADSAGSDAVAALKRGGPRGKQVVAPEFVLQLSSERLSDVSVGNPKGVVGIEDLVPVGVAVLAAKSYALEYVPDVDLGEFDPSAEEVFSGGDDVLSGLVKKAQAFLKSPEFHIDKIGFARHVVDVARKGTAKKEDLDRLATNFAALLRELAVMQREALRKQSEELIRDRVNRIRERFETDNKTGARKEDALLLIEEIGSQLDDSAEAEDARAEMRGWVKQHHLEDDPRSPIEDFTGFLAGLVSLAYLGTRRSQDELA